MPMISYAQHGEDIRLARAFRNQPTGFYIDVGAHDPVALSTTKHFYDLGWRGLNLEAAPAAAKRIEAARQGDISLNVGVSNLDGTMTFYEAEASAAGLSTMSADEVAIHRKAGFKFKEYAVPSMTLASLCRAHVTKPIDFMSIDVEGHERQVLEGADFTVYRPKILVIEATRPLSQELTHQNWEHILVNADYVFAVFDGVNRYYVSKECRELADAITLPPNPFDDYVLYEHQRQIDALRRELSYYSPIRYPVRGIVSVARMVSSVIGLPFSKKSQ